MHLVLMRLHLMPEQVGHSGMQSSALGHESISRSYSSLPFNALSSLWDAIEEGSWGTQKLSRECDDLKRAENKHVLCTSS